MATSDPLLGRQLGDYRIEALIGHGGMARVYRGLDETLDRHAAVKVIEPTLIASGEEEEYRDRFLREARAIARLNHPNIVGIYQFAQEENLYFIAMAHLEGSDLREVLKDYAEKREMMPRKQMLKILHDIANGLDYAHKNDIIHRDIKPSNIIVTTEGNAVLTDFGLALNAVEGTIGNTFGSVHYIAPEQAISSAQAVPQSDQYSLAVIVYELLAGQVPFDDASAMSVALKHISDPPPPIRDLNSKVSVELEAVVMRALDKEPRNRYDAVADFIDAFERALDGSPDALVGQSIAERPVNVPPVSPSMDDDAPTLDRASQSSIGSAIPAPTKTQKMGSEGSSRNMTFILIGVVIVIALIVGGLLAANSAAEATAATETAIAIAIANENATGTAVVEAENATATQVEIIAIANATSTAETEATQIANDNATSTAVVEAENATATQVENLARMNATSTAEAEATQIANDNATSTAVVEAENATATQVENLARMNATSTAEFEATEIANAEATSDAATATESFELTKNAPTLTPSSSPTMTSTPTLSPTPSPTFTPSMTPSPTLTPSPTPIGLVALPGQNQLLLRYDGRSILITNREPGTEIFIDSLVFTKFVQDEDGNFVEGDRFRMTSFTGAPSPVSYQSCLQIWDSSQFSRPSSNNSLRDDVCDVSPFWRTSNNIFWADTESDFYFEVTVSGVDLLGTCPTNRLRSLREERCVIEIP